MDRNLGTLIAVIGLGLVVVGGLIAVGAFGWFGRLPGDLRHDTGSAGVFIPITSMLVVSAVLTLVLNLVGRLWR